MSLEEEKAKRCLAQGVDLGNTLVRLNQAVEDEDPTRIRDIALEFRAKAAIAECLPEGQKMRVQNASEALASFGENNDERGIKQAVDLLRRDIGFPELVVVARSVTPHKTSFGFGKPRASAKFDGYSIRIDGKPVAGFVPIERGYELFDALSKTNPLARVELSPTTRAVPTAPPKAVPVTGKPIREEFKLEAARPGQGYIEQVKENGKLVQVKVFDAAGNLQQTVDRGNFESLD